jgi:hypothetical protein
MQIQIQIHTSLLQKFGHCIFHNMQLGLCTEYGDLLQAGQFRLQILVGERFCLPSRLALDPLHYLLQSVLALFQDNVAKHSASLSAPPSSGLPMGRSCTSAPSLYLHRHVLSWTLCLCFIIAKWIWQRTVIFITMCVQYFKIFTSIICPSRMNYLVCLFWIISTWFKLVLVGGRLSNRLIPTLFYCVKSTWY